MPNKYLGWHSLPHHFTGLNTDLVGADATVWMASQPHNLLGAVPGIGSEVAFSDVGAIGDRFTGTSREWTASADAGVTYTDRRPFTSDTGYSGLILAKPASTGIQVAFSQRHSTDNIAQITLIFGVTTVFGGGDGYLTGFARNDAGTNVGFSADNQADGDWHCWGMSQDTVGGKMYRDGVEQTLNADNGLSGTLINTVQKVRIGNGADYTGTNWVLTDGLALVVVWPRRVQSELLRVLSLNPFDVFEPQSRRQRFIPAAVGGGFQAAWASNSNVLLGAGIQ